MIKARQKATTSYPVNFFMTDSSDHVTGKTGLSPTVTISKNGAAFGAAAGAVSELANGWYSLAGNATDRDTLGDLLLHASAAGADPVDMLLAVVDYDPYATIKLLDAAITTRSSHSAADVWTSATRTLTSFGTLVADIWTYVTRELTGFGTLVSQIIAGLSGAAISLVAPVLSSERVEIVAGDDYKNADGRALNWTLSGFPVFTGGSVLLSAGPLQAAGSVVSATQLRVELTAAQSALLTPGTRVEFKLKVTLSGGNKITAARGYIEVA